MGYKAKGTYPKAAPAKEWLSLLEAAHELDLSYNTVQKMITVTRELRAVKRKGRWIVPRGEITRYLAQCDAETQIGLLQGSA
jgi:hypothetical protein